jgi:hypothetical protein
VIARSSRDNWQVTTGAIFSPAFCQRSHGSKERTGFHGSAFDVYRCGACSSWDIMFSSENSNSRIKSIQASWPEQLLPVNGRRGMLASAAGPFGLPRPRSCPRYPAPTTILTQRGQPAVLVVSAAGDIDLPQAADGLAVQQSIAIDLEQFTQRRSSATWDRTIRRSKSTRSRGTASFSTPRKNFSIWSLNPKKLSRTYEQSRATQGIVGLVFQHELLALPVAIQCPQNNTFKHGGHSLRKSRNSGESQSVTQHIVCARR